MESSIIPIYHFFPNINKLNNQKIITDLKKHKSKIFRSHKINHRWENQYLNFHIVPEVQKIFTLVSEYLKNHDLPSLLVPHSGNGFPVDEFWFNIMEPGDSTGWHNHKEQAFMSGVYYLQVPKNSGHLLFRMKKNNEFIYNPIEVKTGKMILFPSYLDHSVEENKSNKIRISISFNLYKLPINLDALNDRYSMKNFY
tara:strand:- start:699 stop:1289 length:591 start_codon:yes stop_codon:yes gene_type:complete